jgi:hypothetical protein
MILPRRWVAKVPFVDGVEPARLGGYEVTGLGACQQGMPFLVSFYNSLGPSTGFFF